MFKTNKSWEWAFAVLLIALASFLVFNQNSIAKKDKVLGGFFNSFQQASVASRTTVGMTTGNDTIASSTQVLALDDSRVYARCYNRNTNGMEVSLMLGSTATTSVANGIILSSSGSSTPSFFEINQNNQFTGAVYAYAQGTSTVSCTKN